VCLVEAFPADLKLPALQAATDLGITQAWLPDARKAHGGGTAPLRVRAVRVLRYRPGRTCVLRYVLDGSDDDTPTEVIGKVYPRGPKGAEVWQKMGALHALAGDVGITIPRPLARRDGSELIVMEQVPGMDLDGILIRSATEREAKEGVRAAASALASLHDLTLETQESRSLESELERLRRRVRRLHSAAPDLARDVEALLREISQFDLGLPQEGRCLIHGDYKPRQLLLDEDRMAVVDLDRACLGDPAVDVGSFMAVLHKKARLYRQEHLGRLAPYFLERYQACSPRSGLADRARLFQAMTLVRMVVGGFERSPRTYGRKGASWRHMPLLDDAAACLKALRSER
jgi:aminoglycoside phosphotransferase (APT) family kinase protein